MNTLSVIYLKIRTEMRQIHSRKFNEVQLLIVLNCFSFKVSIFIKEKNCTFLCFMLSRHFAFLCTVDVMLIRYVLWEIGKDVLSFGADHLVQMSGHLRHIDIRALFSSSAKYATKRLVHKGHVCPFVRGPA
jgi:hypothetical protein